MERNKYLDRTYLAIFSAILLMNLIVIASPTTERNTKRAGYEWREPCSRQMIFFLPRHPVWWNTETLRQLYNFHLPIPEVLRFQHQTLHFSNLKPRNSLLKSARLQWQEAMKVWICPNSTRMDWGLMSTLNGKIGLSRGAFLIGDVSTIYLYIYIVYIVTVYVSLFFFSDYQDQTPQTWDCNKQKHTNFQINFDIETWIWEIPSNGKIGGRHVLRGVLWSCQAWNVAFFLQRASGWVPCRSRSNKNAGFGGSRGER